MPLISKPNYNQIFASQAPEQDKPAVFNNYPEGWGPESRPNNGKPTIKGFNYLQQTSDLKDLWILQNGACLPYDESIEYAEGAPVLKDGVIQYKTASGFKSRDAVSIPTYNNAADGVDPITGVPDGAYFNVRSSSDESYIDEHQNVGGSAVATGKSYPSSAALNNIPHNNLKDRDAAEAHPASAITDESGKNQQFLNSALKAFNAKLNFAVGLGSSYKVSNWTVIGSIPYFENLTKIQARYPHVTSLNDEVDWVVLQDCINRAANNGVVTFPGISSKTGKGGGVHLNAAMYIINKPLIMPRVGNYDGCAVKLIGEVMAATTIRGTSDFPINRALIEWEDAPLRAWNQTIMDVQFWLPSVMGVSAIKFGISTEAQTSGVTRENLFSESLTGFRLINTSYVADNRYHDAVVDLQGYVRRSEISNLRGNITQGDAVTAKKNTILLKTNSSIYNAPNIFGESTGLAYSTIKDIFGMGDLGGKGTLLSGRFYQCTLTNILNGNGSFDSTPAIYLKNSQGCDIHTIGLEGGVENPNVLIENSQAIDIYQLGLGVARGPNATGIQYKNSKNCRVYGRHTSSATTAFSSYAGSKAVKIDADCFDVKLYDFSLNSSASNEVEILGKDCQINWYNPTTKASGIYPNAAIKVIAGAASAQSIPSGAATNIVFGSASLNADSILNTTTGEMLVSGGVFRLTGVVTVTNAVADAVYELRLLSGGQNASRIGTFSSPASGNLIMNFSSFFKSDASSSNISIALYQTTGSISSLSAFESFSRVMIEKLQ